MATLKDPLASGHWLLAVAMIMITILVVVVTFYIWDGNPDKVLLGHIKLLSLGCSTSFGLQ